MSDLDKNDLNYILEHSRPLWDDFKFANIFITGGTGFIGAWLVQTLLHANDTYHLNLKMTVLTRQHKANIKSLTYLKGDILHFTFPKESFSHYIYAATPVEGISHVLMHANKNPASKFLYLSSGAVYGLQPPHISHLAETDEGDTLTDYAFEKLSAEAQCLSSSLPIKIARIFTLVGPYLPLDKHYAIGNFIAAFLHKTPITVNDGSAIRSYLYIADCIVWLLYILCDGKPHYPYNVGAEEAIRIADLAELVAQRSKPPLKVNHMAGFKRHHRYIPSTQRFRAAFNIKPPLDLITSLTKTIRWYQHDKS